MNRLIILRNYLRKNNIYIKKRNSHYNKVITVKQSAAYIFAGYLYLKLLYLSLACEIETSATSFFFYGT